MNVGRLCSKYGVQRIGFLTLTFADHVTCAKEAGRRFNSLRTHVLGARYAESIAVLERMKSGRIHFHLLVVLQGDIRTGFDFDLAARGVYTSANAELRAEWAFWRSTARQYGFGRTELMPVKSNEEGLSKYVGKYIAKHIGSRETRDKGVRLVRYSQGANPCGTAFMFVSPRSRLWRWQVGEFARRNGCAELADLSKKFGKRWVHHKRPEIMALAPPNHIEAVPATHDSEAVSLWDIWEGDRVERAALVAEDAGCTTAEAYSGLYQSKLVKCTLAFEVPAWRGERLNTARDDFSDSTLITWNPEDLNQVRSVRQRVEAGPSRVSPVRG